MFFVHKQTLRFVQRQGFSPRPGELPDHTDKLQVAVQNNDAAVARVQHIDLTVTDIQILRLQKIRLSASMRVTVICGVYATGAAASVAHSVTQ